VKFVIALLLFLSAKASWSQPTASPKTTGACSPAVISGSAKVTISCTGISTVQANRMIDLMNRILSERLDMKDVEAKLNQLESDLGSLNNALNPTAHAPQESKELLNSAESLGRECLALQSEWAQQDTARILQETEQSKSRIQGFYRNAHAETSTGGVPSTQVAITERKTAEFRSKFGSRVGLLQNSFRRAMPNETGFPNYLSIASPRDLDDFIRHLSSLYQRYLVNQSLSGSPLDSALATDYFRLESELRDFSKDWTKEYMSNYLAGANQYQKSLDEDQTVSATAQADLAAKESKTYHESLEPKLSEWKSRVLLQLPKRPPGPDYKNVSTRAELGMVCSDVTSLGMAFRDVAIQQSQQK